MITIATSTSSARTRCRVSGARRRSRPPPNSRSVAHAAAMSTTSSGIRSGDRLALRVLVCALMALAHRMGIARVDEVDDQHVTFVVDVDGNFVGRLPGEHAPERDGVT